MAETQTAPIDIKRQRCTINQAATLCGVARRTIYNWIDAGKVEYVRVAGGQVRIFVDSLLKKSA